MSTAELAGQTAEPAVAAVAVQDLQVEIEATGTQVISDVSFEISRGEIFGVVGESGSGKTTVGLALLGHARRGLRIAGGSVLLGDHDILTLDEEQLRRLRGTLVSYVPQDPASSLNPALRIGTQLREVIEAHGTHRDSAVSERVAEMMREVALPDDRAFLKRYPHELSGGQQQRVGLAMAFANRPRVIVLDEPTTGLDVTTQAHVLATVRDLCEAHGVAAVYVSHDLAVVANLASRVAVMYAGRVVETGPTQTLFLRAAHPYTRRLIEAIPELSGAHALIGIPGTAPRPGHRPPGCSFAPRRAFMQPTCQLAFPPRETVVVGHEVRCYRHDVVVQESLAARPVATPPPQVRAEEGLVAVRRIQASHGAHQVLFDV